MAELADIEVLAVAETADDALKLLKEQDAVWKLAVVDLFLKQGNGLTILRACKKRRPDQRVIMLTNFATADIRNLCVECGADAIFDKSTELDAFLEFCADHGRNYSA